MKPSPPLAAEDTVAPDTSPPSTAAVATSPRHLRAKLHRLLHRNKRMRHSDFERDQPFSWLHCVVSVVSYVLMLSDVLRTGLGVRGLSRQYATHEPDQYVFFGPYAYPVVSNLWSNETSTSELESTPFWPYKYDTTSTVLRAVVQRLDVTSWSTCVLYGEACDEAGGLSRRSVLEMLDSVVEAVKIHPGIRPSQQVRAGHLSLRVDYAYVDRVHHFAFPWFFSRPNRRTGQAIYYDAQLLQAAPICSTRAPRPYACGETWTNYARMCAREQNDLCIGPRDVWSHATARMREFQLAYSNYTVDFVAFEGMDDYARHSLTFQGMKNFDVVVITRVRQCDASNPLECVTVMIDDYRYEAATVVVNAPNWFGVSAIIRGFGQLYAWARLVALLVGCYFARLSETKVIRKNLFGRIVTTVRTVFLVPSQVMVYGSIVPIACYVVAHLIDSGAVYELMGQQFDSVMGVMSLSLGDLLRGVPEFVVSFVASLTVLAQLRSVSFRDTRVLEVEETVPSSTYHQWRSASFNSTHGFLYRLFFGTGIDYKCLAASAILHIALFLAVRIGCHLLPRVFKYQLLLLTKTRVPYGAGRLWPHSALVVSWHGAFLAKPDLKPKDSSRLTRRVLEVGPRPALLHFSALSRMGVGEKLRHHIEDCAKEPVAMSDSNISRLYERDIHSVDKRTRETISAFYLMNLGVMTDPLTYLQLRVFSGRLIGVYESKLSKRCIMLPFGLTTSAVDIPINWDELELQFVMNTIDLDWRDLLQCG